MSIVNTVVLLSVVVLLPLIPAFLLYKYLPSKTIAEGPFKGLNVHLTGAFAGYFLTFITAGGMAELSATSDLKEKINKSEEQIIELEEQLKRERDSQVDLWTIKGPIEDEDQSKLTSFYIQVRPPDLSQYHNFGEFEMKNVPISKENLIDGTVRLLVNHPEYEQATIKLKSEIDSIKSDSIGNNFFPVNILPERRVEITAPIRMKLDDGNYESEGGVNAEQIN